MASRLALNALLKALSGSDNVYFQPPANVQMKYPCIVYHHDSTATLFADNSPYRSTSRYTVTVISADPDSPIFEKVAKLPMCTFDRSYPADNLNHKVFSLYF